MKDTRTPLFVALAANALNLALDALFIFGLGWGAAGAGLATSAAQLLSLGAMLAALHRRGCLRARDVLHLPSAAEMAPMVFAGATLSTRSIASTAAITVATGSVAGLGAAPLAAHEILRQVWMTCYLALGPLGICAQTLVAGALGAGDAAQARSIAGRLFQLALFWGGVASVGMFTLAPAYVRAVAPDPAVAGLAVGLFPLFAAFQPLEGLMVVGDSVLLGAQDHAHVARGMVVAAVCCVAALKATAGLGWGLLAVWGSLKVLSTGRLVNSLARLRSPGSPLADEGGGLAVEAVEVEEGGTGKL